MSCNNYDLLFYKNLCQMFECMIETIRQQLTFVCIKTQQSLFLQVTLSSIG